MTIAGGKRCSTAVAYLHSALRRSNLALEETRKTLARRLLVEGRRVVGVEYERGGETRVARVRREVILCGGVINSPQLLELFRNR